MTAGEPMRTSLLAISLLLLLLLPFAPQGFAGHTTPGVARPDLTCRPTEALHSYEGSTTGEVAWTAAAYPYSAGDRKPQMEDKKTRGPLVDGNVLSDCVGPQCGLWPYWDPLYGTGWCDGIPGDFDLEWEYGHAAAFLPAGPWATHSICDYLLVPHHGATPRIVDTTGPAQPAFFWGAVDTWGPLFVPTTEARDAATPFFGGDGLMCVTDGTISPLTDPDDWIQFCHGSGTTVCDPAVGGTAPAAGGDGGYWAFPYTGFRSGIPWTTSSGTITS